MHHDPLWLRIFLIIHVSAGLVAFLVAPLALATTKGGKQHRRWGRIYLWAMGIVTVTALPMALFRPVLFLALVSVLSGYLAFSGYRVLHLKELARGGSVSTVDWIAACLAFAACALLCLAALLRPAAIQNMRVVGLIIGSLGMRASVSDMIQFVRRPSDKMFWWYSHLTKFIGSYVAAWTAFSVATLSHLFTHAGIVLWLWPAAVGIPAVVITTASYKRKFNGRQSGQHSSESAAVRASQESLSSTGAFHENRSSYNSS